MNTNDIMIELPAKNVRGMQPVAVWNDLRFTHLPTGLVVEVPHRFTTSQNRNLKTAITMIEVALPNDKCQDGQI